MSLFRRKKPLDAVRSYPINIDGPIQATQFSIINNEFNDTCKVPSEGRSVPGFHRTTYHTHRNLEANQPGLEWCANKACEKNTADGRPGLLCYDNLASNLNECHQNTQPQTCNDLARQGPDRDVNLCSPAKEHDFSSEHFDQVALDNKISVSFIQDKLVSPRPAELLTNIDGSTSKKGSQPELSHQVLGALAGSLFHFALATIWGIPGVIIQDLTDPEAGDLQLNPLQAALFVSLPLITAILGSILSGPLMVELGQRVTLLAALPFALASWLAFAFTPNTWLMQTSRVLLGITAGIYAGSSTNFVAEICHSSHRGRLVGLIDLFRQLGFLFVYVVGSSGLSWRHTSWICGCLSTLIPFITLWFLPNSPRWLVSKGRILEARNSLRFYRGEVYPVDVELDGISRQLQQTVSGATTLMQFKNLRDPVVLKTVVFLTCMTFAHTFTGNIAMIVFSVAIFRKVGGSIDEYTSTLIVLGLRVFGSCFYVAASDKIGRRPLLIGALLMSSTAIGSMGIFFYLKSAEISVLAFDWFPIIAMAIFHICICIAEPTLFLLRAELLPTSVRSVGVSIIYISFYGGAFMVSFLFKRMVRNIGFHGTFLVYCLDGVLMAIMAGFMIPETKGKSLEDTTQAHQKTIAGTEMNAGTNSRDCVDA